MIINPNQVASSNALDLLAARQVETLYGSADEFLFRYANQDVVALALGSWRFGKVPVRVHSSCFSAHYLASLECDCREQLAVTMREITRIGKGVVIFLDQDGRGNGHAGLMRSAEYARTVKCTVGDAYEALGYARDARTYHAVPLVLRHLEVDEIILFTNNPEKLAVLREAGFGIESRTILADVTESDHLGLYYENKRAEGHMIPQSRTS
jgi:GTP cyclohydrolase II